MGAHETECERARAKGLVVLGCWSASNCSSSGRRCDPATRGGEQHPLCSLTGSLPHNTHTHTSTCSLPCNKARREPSFSCQKEQICLCVCGPLLVCPPPLPIHHSTLLPSDRSPPHSPQNALPLCVCLPTALYPHRPPIVSEKASPSLKELKEQPERRREEARERGMEHWMGCLLLGILIKMT